VGHHDGVGGLTAHMVSPEDHARYCFEMARLYADLGDEANMFNYLQKASEAGFDVLAEMHDAELGKYRKDPRVLVMVENAKALRTGTTSVKSARTEVPPLPPLQKN